MSASAEHQVFRVESGTRASYLKLADEPSISSETAVLQFLAGRGIPVPAIEGADPAGHHAGVPCILLREVAGRPLSSGSPGFGAAGALLRRIHETTLDGFGYLDGRSPTLRGSAGSWAKAIDEQTENTEPIASAGLVDADLLGSAVAALAPIRGLFADVRQGHLLHGDFHPRHVYAAGGCITAIIDWGDAASGDPRYDFGRILHAAVVARGLRHGFSVVGRVRDSYGDAPWLPAEGTRDAILGYAIAFTLAAMRSELAGGSPWPPWWPAQSRALAAIVGELQRR